VTKQPAARYLPFYYGATALFMLLDYGFDFNMRVAFLDGLPGWRVAYYAVLLGIFVVTLRWPDWAPHLAVFESLITLASLIITTALKVLIVTEAGRGFVTVSELLNFLVSGFVGYAIYLQRVKTAGWASFD